MLRPTIPTAGLLTLFLNGAALAYMDFDPAVHFPVGDEPLGGALADFDHDGHLDLVVTSDGPDKIELLRGLGDGSLGSPTSLLTGNGSNPRGLVAGDFDLDGDQDLVVSLYGDGALRLILGDGTGQFTLGTTYPVGAEPATVVAADFNGDGYLDVANNNRASGDATVLINNGAGGLLAAVHYPVGAETRGIDTGDLTGDGLIDFAVSSRDDGLVRVFRNIGGGAFQVYANLSSGPDREPEAVAIASLSFDNTLDIAYPTTNHNLLIEDLVSYFVNEGGNGLSGWANSRVDGKDPLSIVIRDFDLDGRFDVVTANASTSTVSALKNSGNCIFFAPVLYAVGQAPEAIVAGDLDHNGADDLISINTGDGSVSVLLNRNGTPAEVAGASDQLGVKLHPAEPNPLRGATKIAFEFPTSAPVELFISDILGRRVRELAHGVMGAGRHEVHWDGVGDPGARLPAGVYLINLRVAGQSTVERIVLTN
ncbi:MAG: VCBS repeat-containing protein [Candidatus Eisenbacteria bacterium]|nr:VCBS repeat-containing protein [Candidatus Eisenbacteria bacterium]